MIDLKKNQNPKYLRIIWYFLAFWILWQFGTAMIRSAFLPRRVQKTLEHYKESPKKNKQMQSSKTEHAQEPKSMFAPQKVEMPKCLAVLGDEALINGQWYKVGSTVEGAKIVAINPESVKILWEKREHTLVPFDVKVQYADQKGASEPPKPTAPPGGGDAPGMGRDRNGGPRGPGMISPDERRQMYERYQNASPEEQEKMRQQMSERFGRRGRGQRSGRPGRSGN